MKKTILILALAVTFVMAGCGKKKTPETNQPQQDTTKQEQVKTEQALQGTLTLPQTKFEPGEEITLSFTATGDGKNPWIGIIPSSTPHGDANKNDEVDISYQYTENKTEGTLTFVAPVDTGSYDFRLNSSGEDKKEVASVTFRVSGPANTKVEITTDKKSYAKGEQMVISFKALPTWDKQAWMGIVPASTKHGKAEDADAVDVGYVYLNGRSKGVWKTNAPSESNSYSIRIFDAYAGKEVKSIDFKVE